MEFNNSTHTPGCFLYDKAKFKLDEGIDPRILVFITAPKVERFLDILDEYYPKGTYIGTVCDVNFLKELSDKLFIRFFERLELSITGEETIKYYKKRNNQIKRNNGKIK